MWRQGAAWRCCEGIRIESGAWRSAATEDAWRQGRTIKRSRFGICQPDEAWPPFVDISIGSEVWHSARMDVASFRDQKIRRSVWDLATGQVVTTLLSGAVSSLAVSPDGNRLATGSDNEIRVWDLTTGKRVTTLQEHSMAVTSVAFSPDGNRVASGSDDTTIRIWNWRRG